MSHLPSDHGQAGVIDFPPVRATRADPTFEEALRAMQAAAAFVHDSALALKTATAEERRNLIPAVTLLHEASTLLHHLTQEFSRQAGRP